MFKKIILKISIISSLLLMFNCQKEDIGFGDVVAPTNLGVTVDVVGKSTTKPNGDGSGKVNFTAKADNAISYKFVYEDGSYDINSSGVTQKRFNKTGVFTYSVTVIASGKGGVSTSKIISVTVESVFTDTKSLTYLTDNTAVGKKWYWSASEMGHLGVGANSSDKTQNYYANYYMAGPWEKAASAESSCLYNNVLTFRVDNGQLKYSLNNGGSTFFNGSYQSVVGGTAGYDYCYAYNTTGEKNVNLAPSETFVAANGIANQTTGTVMNFTDNGFMGYYLGTSSYEILSITENRMVVRCVQGNNAALAWYHIFTTVKPVQDPINDYTNMIWQDEFSTDGAPDSSKWGYDIGAGGWGNNEVQNYTNAAANASVSAGTLKINAIKTGSTYTSARLKTKGKFDFKYGKIEARIKLPAGGGTWPAFWMLGANIDTAPWPACGEIDIMEHKGNVPDVIHGSLHYPGNFGGNANTNTATFAGATTGFKVYKVLWTPNTIRFYVDNVLFHTFNNSSTVPFNSNFFVILNVAMGGTFGGAIDPAFTQGTMEVDYVRVYQ